MSLQAWYRSAAMDYLSIVVQEELAHTTLSELGKFGYVQFSDLNSSKTAFQRRYVAEIMRIDAMERRLRFVEEILAKFAVNPVPPPPAEELLQALAQRNLGQNPTSMLTDMEILLEEKERELRMLDAFGVQLTVDFNRQVEFKHVLEKSRQFVRTDVNVPSGAEPVELRSTGEEEEDGMSNLSPAQQQQQQQLGEDSAYSIRFRFLAGTIASRDRVDFERMVYRVTRGNSYMRVSEIEEELMDPVSNQPTRKEVFVIFFQSSVIQEKLVAVINSFGAVLYPVPSMESSAELQRVHSATIQEMSERNVVLKKNQVDMKRLLRELAKHVNTWKLTLRKEKAVYHTMNLMSSDVSGVLRAEGWVISSNTDLVASTVARVHNRTGAGKSLPNWVTVIPEDQRPRKPPTHFAVNNFTQPFQQIIDTYGIARYQEVNPALFASITFPFCFGIMFGDVAHGVWLFSFALILLLMESRLKNQDLGEIGGLLFNGRYVLLLMGFFSTYCGLIYNDAMSLGLAFFNVTWFPAPTSDENATQINYVRSSPPQVYPFGADPTWRIAGNEIAFYNSFKMKFAVVVGVVHMMLGIGLKAANAIHFHKGKKGPNLDLLCEALPQMAFLGLLFGYMDFLIIYKWSIPWGDECDRSECQPPSLITTMISMFLSPGSVAYPMYPSQGVVQVLIVLCAVGMVPIMLCVKPYILIKRMRKHQALAQAASGEVGMGEDETLRARRGGADEEEEEEEGGGGHRGGRSVSSAAAAAAAADREERGSVSSNHALLREGELARSEDGSSHHHEEDDDDEHGEEEHGVGDIIIHQAIETIEFVLGSISNTASYLRLWALSLAHSQLAAVFWERTILPFLKSDSGIAPISSFIGTSIFISVTLGVLMAMDNLECFLHALRLHWVEFMSKFFKAEGIKFTPLDFPAVFEQAMAKVG